MNAPNSSGQPPAPTTITTDAAGLVAGWQTITASDGFALPIYAARPDGDGPFPIALVVQEIFGVHAHIADVARRLARLGYHAVAPELFARLGDPRSAPDIDALRRDFVARADDAQVLRDLDRAAEWAAANHGDGRRLLLTGFCWGGRIAWLYAAHQPRLAAAVAWYGRLEGERTALQPRHPRDVARGLRAPVLGLYGGQDAGIPLAQVEAHRAAIAGSGSEMHVYPDAPHAFFADDRPSYRAADAADGWARLRRWFAQHGVAPA